MEDAPKYEGFPCEEINENINKHIGCAKITSAVMVKLYYNDTIPEVKICCADRGSTGDVKINADIVDEKLEINIETINTRFKGYVEIKLPKCENLTVITTAEDVFMEGVDVEDIVVNTTSGDVSVVKAKFNKACVQSDYGDVSFDTEKVKYKLCLETDNGEIVKENVRSYSDAKKSITCKTKSGDIHIT
ncbi:MAG: DUF4097 family beta strand repeat protein [Clostridia bacterium]|nr:DUF4097 family beta strand repeat protein [Clostridia bacterium]